MNAVGCEPVAHDEASGPKPTAEVAVERLIVASRALPVDAVVCASEGATADTATTDTRVRPGVEMPAGRAVDPCRRWPTPLTGAVAEGGEGGGCHATAPDGAHAGRNRPGERLHADLHQDALGDGNRRPEATRPLIVQDDYMVVPCCAVWGAGGRQREVSERRLLRRFIGGSLTNARLGPHRNCVRV